MCQQFHTSRCLSSNARRASHNWENPSFPLREAMTFLFLDMIYNLILTKTATEKFPTLHSYSPRKHSVPLWPVFRWQIGYSFYFFDGYGYRLSTVMQQKSWLLASISQEAWGLPKTLYLSFDSQSLKKHYISIHMYTHITCKGLVSVIFF